MPPEPERAERLRVVLHVLYLIFNEGYIASSGPDLQRGELTREAIRLTRAVHALLPDDGEVAGPARADAADRRAAPGAHRAPTATLVAARRAGPRPVEPAPIDEGIALITDALAHAPLGPYQLQAAIAAVHDEAPRAEDTDWPQILALYELLERVAPNPMVTLNHAVAVAMVHGPRAGLELLATLDDDERMAEPPPPRRRPRPPARDGRRPRRRRAPATGPRRGARRASPSSATSRRAPRGSAAPRLAGRRLTRRARGPRSTPGSPSRARRR